MQTVRRLLFLALIVQGCDCGDGASLNRLVPELELEAELVDFGEVPLGATKRVRFAVRNAGNASLEIISVDVGAPFAALIIDTEIATGASGTIDLSFTPRNDELQTQNLVIVSNDDSGLPANVELRGRGVEGHVTVLPSTIDLTNTAVGVSRSAEIVLSNLGIEEVSGQIVTEGFARPEHFALSTLSNFATVGQFALTPRGENSLDLEYRPFEFGEDQGRIVFEICGERCGLEVEVVASAAQPVVRMVPPVVDFGGVGLGETRTQQVVVENVGGEPVQITSVATAGGPELTAQPSRSVPLELEAGSSVGINVEFTPRDAVAFEGEVIVTTTDPLAPEVHASVIGSGEGPLFVVSPEAISFGAQRDIITHRRSLLLINAGSSDVTVETVSIAGAPELTLDSLPGLPARIGSGQSIVVNVAFTPAVLGEYSATVTVTTDDPARPIVDVPVLAGLTDQLCELRNNPERVNFGLIPPSFQREKSTTLTNIGTDDCRLLSGDFRIPLDPYITLVSSPFPVTLTPGQSAQLDFHYAPQDMVESKANFVVQTDDPVFPERHITLLGTAEGYVDIFTVPEVVDFGSVRPMCDAGNRLVQIFNAGTVDVQVDNLVLTSTTPELRLIAPNTPFPLPAGSVQDFQVGYRADDLGADAAEVEIFVRDLPYQLVVLLEGEGHNQPRIRDQFQQTRQTSVDVLFVIDDSCSMADDQQALAQNFSSFISQANLRNVDFQIGITTTTLQPVAGGLVGPILTTNTFNLTNAFTQQASVGITGSGIERGLDAMAGAINLANSPVPSLNQGLLRVDAGLVVIIVSDEDDQSALPTVFYFNLLRNAAPAGFVTAVVAGGPAGCASVNGPAAPSPRYEDFARLTMGQSESICSSWAGTLSNLGNLAFGLARKFDLSQPADQGDPIRVFVDGTEVSQTGNWMYDAAQAAIIFSVPPPEGSEIVVEYTPDC